MKGDILKMDNKIDERFREVLESLDDDEFWRWVRSWNDESQIMDTIHDWDDDAKLEAIKEMEEIIENGRGK